MAATRTAPVKRIIRDTGTATAPPTKPATSANPGPAVTVVVLLGLIALILLICAVWP